MEMDIHTDGKVELALTFVARAIDTNGIAIDTNGYEGLEYQIAVGVAFAGGGYDVTLEQSPDDGSGSPTGVWTAVPAEEILGVLPVIAIADADQVYRVGSIGKERHQRAVFTETGTITAGLIGAIARLGFPHTKPEPDQST